MTTSFGFDRQINEGETQSNRNVPKRLSGSFPHSIKRADRPEKNRVARDAAVSSPFYYESVTTSIGVLIPRGSYSTFERTFSDIRRPNDRRHLRHGRSTRVDVESVAFEFEEIRVGSVDRFRIFLE